MTNDPTCTVTLELSTPELHFDEGEDGREPTLRVTDGPYVIELELLDSQVQDLLYEILRYMDGSQNSEGDR